MNPEIISYGKTQDLFEEGCLSFPELYGNVQVRGFNRYVIPGAWGEVTRNRGLMRVSTPHQYAPSTKHVHFPTTPPRSGRQR